MHTTMRDARSRRPARGRRHGIVGPDDHGRHMTLGEFASAEAVAGYQYELARGVVEVTNIPGFLHHFLVRRLNTAITLYDHAHPGVIFSVGGGAEAKLDMW